MQLSNEEKDHLHTVIVAFVGDDPSLHAVKPAFNENTVTAVEEMISQNLKCNESMKLLVAEMLSGGRVMASGWLRRSLGAASKAVKASVFNGAGCRSATRAKWMIYIVLTAS